MQPRKGERVLSETRPERERRKSQVDVPNGFRATQRGVSESGEAQGFYVLCPPEPRSVLGTPQSLRHSWELPQKVLGVPKSRKRGKGDTFHRQTDRDTR